MLKGTEDFAFTMLRFKEENGERDIFYNYAVKDFRFQFVLADGWRNLFFRRDLKY